MTVETHLHRARERVESEHASVAAKRDSLAAFADRIRDVSTSSGGVEQAGGMVGGGVSVVSQRTDQREVVRSAFAETVGQYTGGDSVVAGLRAELGDDVALAFAPTTNTQFSPHLKRQLLSQTTARRQELSVTLTALDRERESVATHREIVDETVEWLVEADETPLSNLGFDRLRARHERLETLEREIVDATAARQGLLDATTSEDATVGLAHRSLVASLYEDYPVEYPVLSTLTRVLDVCLEAKQAVRDHLVRRA